MAVLHGEVWRFPALEKERPGSVEYFQNRHQRELLGSKYQRVDGIRLQERVAYLVLNEGKTTKAEPRKSTSERNSQAENSDLQKTDWILE